MMPIQCAECKHYTEGLKCAAFPNGIPKAVITNEYDHRESHPGDHGIQFEPLAADTEDD